jgi:hypothetical protein
LARRQHTAEEIIGKLRQAEVALAQGIAVPDVCRRLGGKADLLPLAKGVHVA